MTFYTEWQDFVTYTYDPDRVTSREQRLDVSKAMELDELRDDFERSKTAGVRIPFSFILFDNDEFEGMRIGDYSQ